MNTTEEWINELEDWAEDYSQSKTETSKIDWDEEKVKLNDTEEISRIPRFHLKRSQKRRIHMLEKK